MSTATIVVAAMAGSAPSAPNSGPKTLLTKAVRKGAAARMPALGRKMGPMESIPATNSWPSSLSGRTAAATAPAKAQAMIT